MNQSIRKWMAAVIMAVGMQAFAEPDDWQIWSEQGIKGAFDDQWTLTLRQEEKWSDQQGGLVEYSVDAGLNYKSAPNWNVGLNYRQVYEEKGGEWFEENRPHINVTYVKPLDKVTVSDRSRLELRVKEDKSDIVRYRNKLTIQCNQGYGGWKLYVADELFFDSQEGNFNRNRFYVGLKGKPASKAKVEIYGLWQRSDKGSFWQDILVFGLKAYASF